MLFAFFFIPLYLITNSPNITGKTKMKINSIITIACAALVLASCSEKKKSDVIIMEKYETPQPTAPIRMEDYHDTDVIDWLNNKYTYDILRTASDSLPKVKDEDGQKYFDNTATLTISRSDNSVFLKKTFTKAFFNSVLNDNISKKGILDGFVFHEVDGDVLQFAASVTYPQSDESIPIIIRITRMGDISVKRGVE